MSFSPLPIRIRTQEDMHLDNSSSIVLNGKYFVSKNNNHYQFLSCETWFDLFLIKLKSLFSYGYHEYRWYKNNQLHRIGKPAFITSNGHQEWFQKGIRQRMDGPSVEYSSGRSEWFFGNLLHRVDGPVSIESNGRQYWYFQGEQHRDNAPAVECSIIGNAWYKYGKLHRESGPAIDSKRAKQWYLHGIQYSEEEYIYQLDKIHLHNKLQSSLSSKPKLKKLKI